MNNTLTKEQIDEWNNFLLNEEEEKERIYCMWIRYHAGPIIPNCKIIGQIKT